MPLCGPHLFEVYIVDEEHTVTTEHILAGSADMARIAAALRYGATEDDLDSVQFVVRSISPVTIPKAVR